MQFLMQFLMQRINQGVDYNNSVHDLLSLMEQRSMGQTVIPASGQGVPAQAVDSYIDNR